MVDCEFKFFSGIEGYGGGRRTGQDDRTAFKGKAFEIQKLDKFSDEAQDYRARMFSLAGYMEERWPTTIAGNLARHSIGLQFLREERYGEAIKKLSLIDPSYGNYTLVCYQLSGACNRASRICRWSSSAPVQPSRPSNNLRPFPEMSGFRECEGLGRTC